MVERVARALMLESGDDLIFSDAEALARAAIAAIAGEEIDPKTLDREIDWYLKPTFFDGAVMHRYGGNPPELTTADIMNRANAFIAASNRVWLFSEKISALRMPPSEPLAPKA